MENKSTNEKLYYNADLDKILRKYITRGQYGKFDIILHEIFHRRAYEYEFSKEHIENEVINFIKRIERVEFVDKNDPNISSETCMGVYIPSEKCIKLNQDFFLKEEKLVSGFEFGSKMFQTLTHEVYHGITDNGTNLGLMHRRRNENFFRGAAINEVMTETAANRACLSRGAKEAEQYRAETNGYTDITFFANLLAASCGTTEKSLLRAGIQNRDKVIDIFISRFPQNEVILNKAMQLFQKMESSLDIIYNNRYKKDKKDCPKTIEELEADRQILESSLSTLYGTAFELASFQLENESLEMSKQTIPDIKYRYLKMERIIEDSLNQFKYYGAIFEEDKQIIYSKILKQQKDLANRIIEIDTVDKQGYKILNNETRKSLILLARSGSLHEMSEELYMKYGIQIPQKVYFDNIVYNITDNLEYSNYVMKEDFDNGRQWDNRDAAIVMKKIFVSEMERKGLRHSEIQTTTEYTQELPTIDWTEKMEEIPIVSDESKKKGIFEKIKKSINNIITRFKNRNNLKLNQENPYREEQDNSEYYASLVTKPVDDASSKSVWDKYRVDVEPLSMPLDINKHNNETQNKKRNDKYTGR